MSDKLQDAQLQKLTECSICCEAYTDPKSLPCLHTFCFKCLRGYGANKQPGDSLFCPLCRAEFAIPAEGLGTLPNNFFVGQLLEVSRGGSLRRFCDKHVENELLMYCRKCKLAVCVTCISTQHRGHEFCELENSSESFKELLRDSHMKINRYTDTTKRELELLEKEKSDILNQISVGEQRMIKEFDKLIQIINGRREQLETKFYEIRKNRLREIESRKSKIENRLTIIDEFNQLSDTLIATGSPYDITRSANGILAKGDILIRSQDEFNEGKLSKITVVFTSHDKRVIEIGRTNFIGWIKETRVGVGKPRLRLWNTSYSFILSAVALVALLMALFVVRDPAQQPVFTARAYLNKQPSLLDLPVKGAITGLTVIGGELFVTRGTASLTVDVYNTNNVTLTRSLTIPDSSWAMSIVASNSCACLPTSLLGSSNKNNNCSCLYIPVLRSSTRAYAIYQYNLLNDFFSILPWTYEQHIPQLSLTKKNTIIVTSTISTILNGYNTYEKRIFEYTSNWSLHKEINIKIDSPWHGIRLPNDHFLVSHGTAESENRICVVDNSGNVILSYGGQVGSGVDQLNEPVHMAMDKFNNVLIADKNNNRIELLSIDLGPTFTHLGYLTISGQKLIQPTTLHLDEQNHRLYVGDSRGQVFVFEADVI